MLDAQKKRYPEVSTSGYLLTKYFGGTGTMILSLISSLVNSTNRKIEKSRVRRGALAPLDTALPLRVQVSRLDALLDPGSELARRAASADSWHVCTRCLRAYINGHYRVGRNSLWYCPYKHCGGLYLFDFLSWVDVVDWLGGAPVLPSYGVVYNACSVGGAK